MPVVAGAKRKSPLPRSDVEPVTIGSGGFLIRAAQFSVPSEILCSRLRFTTSSRFFSSMVIRTAPSFAQSGFEFSQRLEHIVKLADVDPRDCGPLLRGNRNKTGSAQSAKRFAYGCSPNAAFSADAWRVEASARLRSSGQNVLHRRTKAFVRERHGLSTAWALEFHIRLRGLVQDPGPI